MLRVFPGVVLVLALSGCAKKLQPSTPRYNIIQNSNAPDYIQLDHWAAHPFKWDPSDSIPRPLRGEPKDSVADVFFIHPTTYTGNRAGWNADINDNEINSKTDNSAILYQASVFNQHARVFAPRYRQAHLSAFYSEDAEAKAAFDTAYSDLKRSFDLYLKQHHRNRPVIIAGHSQGGLMAMRLLKEYFDGKPLSRYLVAAYVVGWPVPKNSFEKIPVCRDSLQTACFCSWRTLREDYLPDHVEKESPVAEVTNPLSWTTSEDYVSREENKGSILRDFNQLVLNTTDAKVHGGVLWVSRPKFPGSIFYNTKNYHIGDINLYYMNVRINIAQRIHSWMKKNQDLFSK
jgi:pimeloyl-ACP methyl ester carboxylesterase